MSSVRGELSCVTLLSTALKEQGNEAFGKGDYDTAVLRYSEGLEKLKDMKVLYTNRAQVSESQVLCVPCHCLGNSYPGPVRRKTGLGGALVGPCVGYGGAGGPAASARSRNGHLSP